ncbi:uncharacterized protein LOC111390794 [Olea europaea var. sylvestris]|uniref:uncharacterized protein LOC111390794 n=1 Tax=Olea europaea var. sylvestris TaxID=158386 RepID=UPI000C1D763E|nr:uncharacterized protein LOC111390794 [Olea europaea var. sylvestris]
MNHAVIVLVPKANHSASVGDYRPISCCNVFYKVIAKIITSRLGPILGSIVNQAQGVFVEDLKKAYDSVNWEFLKIVLHGFGFPMKFIGWGDGMYIYSFVFDCTQWKLSWIFLKGKRVFIKGAMENSEFNYHPKCGPLKITHLVFANDLMLFAGGDPISVGILMDCLSKFGDI